MAAGIAVLTLVVASPALVAILDRWGAPYLPLQDVAVIDLRVRDVFSGHPPLTGVYSQFGWNHPGPLLFYALALVMQPLGGAPWTLVVAGAVLHVAAIVACAIGGWRWGGPAAALVALATLGLTHGAVGPWFVLETWNPHIAVPWLVLFVLAAWRASQGPGPALPIAVGVASFLVQTHVGYVPLVGAVGVWLAAVAVGSARSNRELQPAAWRTTLIATAVVATVAWIGPVIDIATDPPGNAGPLVEHFLGDDDGLERVGAARALRLFAASFELPPPGAGGGGDVEALTGTAAGATPIWLLVPIGLATAGALLWRGAPARTRRALELVALLNVTGLVALMAVQHPAAPYLFLWRTPLAVLAALVVGAAAVERAGTADRTARSVRAAATVLVVSAAALPSLGLAGAVLRAEGPIHRYEPDTAALLAQLDRARLEDRTVVIDFAGSPIGGLQGGILDALDRDGVPFRVPNRFGFQFGAHRGIDPSAADEVWIVVESGALLSELAALPGAEVLASSTPLGPGEEAELAQLQAELTDALLAAGRPDLLASLDSSLVAFSLADVPDLDAAALDRLGALNAAVEAGGCRCGVVALPSDEVPPGVAGEREPSRPVGS